MSFLSARYCTISAGVISRSMSTSGISNAVNNITATHTSPNYTQTDSTLTTMLCSLACDCSGLLWVYFHKWKTSFLLTRTLQHPLPDFVISARCPCSCCEYRYHRASNGLLVDEKRPVMRPVDDSPWLESVLWQCVILLRLFIRWCKRHLVHTKNCAIYLVMFSSATGKGGLGTLFYCHQWLRGNSGNFTHMLGASSASYLLNMAVAWLNT